MSKDEATFKINVEGNAAAASRDVATSARQAASAISTYENEIKTLSTDLRRLRGNSDDVVAAKKAVKAKIDAAKSSVSALTAELVKNGQSYKAASDAAKKYAATGPGKLPHLRAAIGKALGAVGGKAGELMKPLATKLSPLAKALGAKIAPVGKALGTVGKVAKEDLGSVLPSVGSMLGVVASGAALATAAALAVGAAFVAATAALAAFVLGTADSYGKMNRQREALLGTAKDAGALSDQIGQLATVTPKTIGELSGLAHSLNKTRISGRATVDALAAIAQVSGAVDDAAGAKIQDLITRNDKFGRMAIGMFELDGTGLDFSDVAKAYAEGTKKSLEAAQNELRMGIAPIEAGSKAIRDAAEKKFGKLNIANAFSLENAPKKFMDQVRELSKDVDLEPLSSGLKEAFGQLSPNAPLGAAVKQFMTVFGGAVVEVGAKAIPVLLEGLKWMVVWGLKIALVFIETKNAIVKAFDDGDWVGVGKAVITGLVKGIVIGQGAIYDTIRGVGKASIEAFKGVLGIHSPSKVFASFGEHTTEGYAQGVERGTQRASNAVASMVEAPEVRGGAAPIGLQPITVDVTINGAPTHDAQAMAGPAMQAMLTMAIRDALTGSGRAPA